MGFRNGAYATVWGVEPGKTDRYQQVRLSTSRKNKKTGQFEQDFSGFCRFIGNANEAANKLVSMLPKAVCVEDLNVTGMMKNHHLSKAIQEQCLGEFLRQMEYKCAWNGIELVKVDRFYPSSKTCSCCGEIKRDLKLSDRTYVCPHCGLVIDRDYNAALNLMKYAVSQVRAAA